MQRPLHTCTLGPATILSPIAPRKKTKHRIGLSEQRPLAIYRAKNLSALLLVFWICRSALFLLLDPCFGAYFSSVSQLTCSVENSPRSFCRVVHRHIIVARKLAAQATMLNVLLSNTRMKIASAPERFALHLAAAGTFFTIELAFATVRATRRSQVGIHLRTQIIPSPTKNLEAQHARPLASWPYQNL